MHSTAVHSSTHTETPSGDLQAPCTRVRVLITLPLHCDSAHIPLLFRYATSAAISILSCLAPPP